MSVNYGTQISRVFQRIEAAAKKRAFKVGNIIRTAIVKGMAGKKGGRRYRVPGTKRYYTASAPGEYPAVRTGVLRAGVKVATAVDAQGAHAVVGTNIKYGVFLEGEDGRGIRPWLSKAFKQTAEDVQKAIEERWEI